MSNTANNHRASVFTELFVIDQITGVGNDLHSRTCAAQVTIGIGGFSPGIARASTPAARQTHASGSHKEPSC